MKNYSFLIALALAACAPSTPQTRIEKFPEKFTALNPKEQSLVRQGQIAPGMPQDGVLLAWGFPDQRFEGSRNSQMTGRWDYATSIPVCSSTHFLGSHSIHPRRHGSHWHRRCPDFVFATAPEIVYVPQRIASVWFIEGRVDAWERVR